jgi:hypothetical protein
VRAPNVTAGKYFAAIDRYGSSPAGSLAELEASGPEVRAEADRILREAGRLAIAPADPSVDARPAVRLTGVAADGARAATRAGGCVDVAPLGPGSKTAIPLAAGTALVVTPSGDAPVTIGVRRFGDAIIGLGAAAPGQPSVLDLPADDAPRPWVVEVTAGARFRACGRR